MLECAECIAGRQCSLCIPHSATELTKLPVATRKGSDHTFSAWRALVPQAGRLRVGATVSRPWNESPLVHPSPFRTRLKTSSPHAERSVTVNTGPRGSTPGRAPSIQRSSLTARLAATTPARRQSRWPPCCPSSTLATSRRRPRGRPWCRSSTWWVQAGAGTKVVCRTTASASRRPSICSPANAALLRLAAN